ncbi:CPBP family intramembrane metalloprotease [Candidatus Saccharibacteria bacterium]|nr:CPBP family intramembrane metalloprotease [Candidatus Saccharibacteria bacterium]
MKKTMPAPKKLPKKQGWLRNLGYVAFIVVWVFVSVVASQFVTALALQALLPSELLEKPVVSGIYSVISYGLSIILTFVVLPKIYKKLASDREEVGLKDYPTWTDIGLAPVGWIVSTIGAGLLMTFFNQFSWFEIGQAQDTGFSPYMNGGERIIAFLVLVILAPIAEEVIFRGWLYGKLRACTNLVTSILITSLLFAIMHWQWNVSVNVFALSVVLCGMREITGTIYAGILTHMLKNGIAFFLLYVIPL